MEDTQVQKQISLRNIKKMALGDLRGIVYPRQVVLITSKAEAEVMGKRSIRDDVMAASWHTPLSFSPQMYAVVVGKERFTYKLIKKSRVFCVNFIPYSMEKTAVFAGSNSGEHMDKFKEGGIIFEECEKIECIRLKDCLAFLECEVENEVEAGDHVIFIGRVVNSGVKKKSNERLFQLLQPGGRKFGTVK